MRNMSKQASAVLSIRVKKTHKYERIMNEMCRKSDKCMSNF